VLSSLRHGRLSAEWLRGRQRRTQTGGYEGGKAFGTFAGCGWIGSDGNSLSPRHDTAAPEPGKECGGTPIDNKVAFVELGSICPWLSGQPWSDLIYETGTTTARIIATWGYKNRVLVPRFAWRYVANADGQYWITSQDRRTARGDGNWVFVQSACIV
jgi:hypothetical protein